MYQEAAKSQQAKAQDKNEKDKKVYDADAEEVK